MVSLSVRMSWTSFSLDIKVTSLKASLGDSTSGFWDPPSRSVPVGQLW